MKNFRSSFGESLRSFRGRSALSQETLAARAGIHRTYVSSIERGTVGLGLEIAKKIADALGVPLHKLVADAEARQK